MDTWKIKFINQIRCLIPFEASSDVLDFVACQFALESSFGRSHLAVKYLNYCGMKRVSKRISSQISFDSGGYDFGHYHSLYECIIDYSLWLAFNKATNSILFDLDKFKSFLIKYKYCPDVDYIPRITNLLNSYQNAK